MEKQPTSRLAEIQQKDIFLGELIDKRQEMLRNALSWVITREDPDLQASAMVHASMIVEVTITGSIARLEERRQNLKVEREVYMSEHAPELIAQAEAFESGLRRERRVIDRLSHDLSRGFTTEEVISRRSSQLQELEARRLTDSDLQAGYELISQQRQAEEAAKKQPETLATFIPGYLEGLRQQEKLPGGFTRPLVDTLVHSLASEGSSDESAASLGLRPGTYRVRLHRARKALRDALMQNLNVPPNITFAAIELVQQNALQRKDLRRQEEDELTWQQSEENTWYNGFTYWLQDSKPLEVFNMLLVGSDSSYPQQKLMKELGVEFRPETGMSYQFVPQFYPGTGSFLSIYDANDITKPLHRFMFTDASGNILPSIENNSQLAFLRNLKGKGASLIRLLAGYGPEDITISLQPFKKYTSSNEKNETNHIEIMQRLREKTGIAEEIALPAHYEFDSVLPGLPFVDRKAPYNSVTFYTPEGEAVLTIKFGMKENKYILQSDFEGKYHKRASQKVVMDTKAYLRGERLSPPKFLPINVREVHSKDGYRWKYASFGERLTVSSSLAHKHVLPGIFQDSETGIEYLALWLPDDSLRDSPYSIFELDERNKFRRQTS